MASSVLDILTAAALQLGATQLGEQLTAIEVQAMLSTWQRLIDSESILRGSVFTEREDIYTLIPGTQSYTLGTDPTTTTAGTLSATRPDRIVRANLLFPGTPSTEIELDILTDSSEWADIAVKNFTSLPQKLYSDGGYPYDTWFFYPIPNQAFQVKVYTWQALTQVVNLTDFVYFPRGYERKWVTQLAIESGPLFGIEPSATLRDLAWQADRNVRSLNSRSPMQKMDPSFLGNKGSGYNWLTGKKV